MTKTWVVADPHFGHMGVCRFLRADGVTPLRPWNDPEEMDKALVEKWNDVVSDKDRVYLLGDVAINKKMLATLGFLKGRKVLVKGNHDIYRLKDYTPYFDDIRAYVVKLDDQKNKIILSHIPIHPESLGRFGINIHGHLHSNRVMLDGVPDERYVCVSVEHTNYAPIELAEAIKRGKAGDAG